MTMLCLCRLLGMTGRSGWSSKHLSNVCFYFAVSQVPLLLDVGTVCCDVANFSKDCYVTYQPTGRNNSLSYNCQSPSVSHARYLRLVHQTASPVEICEVQIFGCLSLSKGAVSQNLLLDAGGGGGGGGVGGGG